MRKRVVIVGGSYGGIRALENLYKDPDVEIYLIEKNSFHYLQPEVYGYVAGTFNISDIIIDLYTLCASYGSNVKFLQQTVVNIEFDRKKVITVNGEIDYDYLILATGARTWFPESVKGLGDVYRGGIKSVKNALIFKQHFENYLYKMIEIEGFCNPQHRFSVVVGGAGLSGVETAAEMAWYANELFKNYGFMCKNVDVILVASKNEILENSDPFLIEASTKRLEALGVKILYGKKIVSVTPTEVELDDKSKIHMDFLIWTGGIIGSELARTLELPKNSKHFIFTDKHYKLQDIDDVFVIGDAAVLVDPITQAPMPPTSQMAERTAEYVARNILRKIRGESFKTEALKMQGMFVALGGSYGAGVMMDKMRVKGYKAHILKQLIFKAYKLPLIARCKKGAKALQG